MKEKYNNCRDFLMAFYPRPRIYKILIALAYRRGEPKAKIIEEAVNIYVNSLDLEEQKKCLDMYEALPQKTRKHPRNTGN